MKKYKKTIVGLILASVLFLSGCSHDEIPKGEQSFSKVDDPLKTPVESGMNTSDTLKLATYGLFFSEDDISFNDGILKVTPTLAGGEDGTSAGIVILIDGIPQEYSADGSSNKTTMSTFEIEAESEEKHTLIVDAKIDSEKGTHYISMLSLVVPDYVPDAEAPTFGFYHSGIYNIAKILPNDCQTLPMGEYSVLKTENAPLTQKQTERYNIKEDDGNSDITDFVLRQNKDDGLESWFIKGSEDGLKLTFAGYTNEHTTAEQFRITFYKNHKLCKFNGGYSALDMTLEGGKIVEMEVALEGVEAGDFVYCVASPLNVNKKGVKSRSKMVLDSNGTSEGENNSSKNESGNDSNNGSGIDNGSNDSSISGGNSGSSEPDINNEDEISSRLTPVFTIGDTIYFTTREDDILTLCSSKNGKDIEKKYPLENYRKIANHGEYISFWSMKEPITATTNLTTFILTLLDKDLNVVKKAEISELQNGLLTSGSIDFDYDKIVYLYHSREIRCCDWDFGNVKTLLTLPRDDVKIARFFEGITLADNYVAFTAGGTEGKTDKDFYGVCDFLGNFEIHQKDEIAIPSTFGATAVWEDMHRSYGVKPSGEIITYQNGQFQTIKTENTFESQNVFLCDEDTIITTTAKGDVSDCVIRIYKNGKLVLKKPFEKDAVVFAIAKLGDNYIIKFTKPDSSKVVIWELK